MIFIDFSTLDISNSQTVTGEISFLIDETYFPHRNWNDFIVIISNWWLEQLHDLIQSKSSGKVDLLFMDGPFKVSITNKNEYWLLFFIRNHNTIIQSELINPSTFVRNFLTDVNMLLRICTNRDWINADTKKLQNSHQKLVRLINRINF